MSIFSHFAWSFGEFEVVMPNFAISSPLTLFEIVLNHVYLFSYFMSY